MKKSTEPALNKFVQSVFNGIEFLDAGLPKVAYNYYNPHAPSFLTLSLFIYILVYADSCKPEGYTIVIWFTLYVIVFNQICRKIHSIYSREYDLSLEKARSMNKYLKYIISFGLLTAVFFLIKYVLIKCK